MLVLRRREYVARVLVGSIPGMSQADAYLVMQKAHKQGMAVVGIWVFEVAEAYCDKLKSGGLIASVTEAVKQAEQAQYEAEAPIRAKLKELARCPAGFDWHRDGDGWRCNGGSHFVSNDDLPTING